MTNGVARFCLALLTAVVLSAVWPAAALAKDKGGKGGQSRRVEAQVAVEIFRERDREIIRTYYAGNRSALPPGLAKREGSLPPGLEKQLRRKGQLPPGLQKRITPFPVELERQLPPLKAGLRRGVIEGRAVIFGERTSTILDVMVVF